MATIFSRDDFDGDAAAERLHDAMKGLGTDEDEIIDVIASHDNRQRQEIKDAYKTAYGKDLEDALEREIKRDLQHAVLACLQRPREYDARELRAAMKGPGTDDNVLIEIMCTRTNEELAAIKAIYAVVLERELEEDLERDTAGNFSKLLISMCNGGREEDDGADNEMAVEDAQALFEAGEGSWGTDESEFNRILSVRSYQQLRRTFDVYAGLSGQDIEDAVRREFTGNLEEGFMTIVKRAKNEHALFAERLHDSMRGAGTDDDTLIRIIVSRSEVDLMLIKLFYKKMFGSTLYAAIETELSGDYKQLMLKLITEVEQEDD